MDQIGITKILTKTVVLILFWVVFGFSLYMEAEITLQSLLLDLIKSLVIAGFSWIFVSIIFDVLVKSIIASAKESKTERFDGELSYHFIDPDSEESLWQELNLEELEDEVRSEKRR